MAIRLVARIHGIHQSPRNEHRVLEMEIFRRPMTLEEQDPFEVAHGHLLPHGMDRLTVEIPVTESVDLKPGGFLAFEVVSLKETERQEIERERERRLQEMKQYHNRAAVIGQAYDLNAVKP